MGYFPNGTSSMVYEERFCARCTHHNKKDEGGCPVWLAHLLHNYTECNKPDSILHILIPRDGDGNNKQCAMFAES